MRKIFVLLDCPLKGCSKLWVIDELEKLGYRVIPVPCRFVISQIEQRGKVGRIFARFLVFWQCLMVIMKSHQTDILFCWNHFSGLYMNQLAGKRRNILSYNWLTPTPRKRTLFLYRNALNNPRLAAIINSQNNKERLLKDYEATDLGNIYYIPDVYDPKQAFVKADYPVDEKYCFMGGRANRDWVLFLQIAEECTELKFVGVAARSDWDKDRRIPSNVRMYFDTPQETYYELLQRSFLGIYPLKTQQVAGLVNIVKSIQMGKLVYVTDIPATRMYYTAETKEALQQPNDKAGWVTQIRAAQTLTEVEYETKVNSLQKHLQASFSPTMAIQTINEIIKRRFD